MEELFRMFAEAYRTSSAHPFVAASPVVAGAPPVGPWWAPTLPGLPPLPSLFDWIRLQALMYEESRRIQDVVLERVVAPSLRAAHQAREGREGQSESSPATEEGDIQSLLHRVQLLLLRHPIATQAAFAALIAEGRRFAATPEGAAWKTALASSELVRQSRRVWDAVSLNMLEEDPATIIPSAYLEALLRAAKSVDLDALLGALRGTAKGGEHAAPR